MEESTKLVDESTEALWYVVHTYSGYENKVANDLQSKTLRAEMEKNLSLGRALGLTGTPSYVVGNRILSGAVGYEELKAAVEEARTKAAA